MHKKTKKNQKTTKMRIFLSAAVFSVIICFTTYLAFTHLSFATKNTLSSTGESTPVIAPQIIWSADHEEGTLSDWFYPSTTQTGNYGGGEYNSGIADTTVSSEQAHTGNYSTKMVTDTANNTSSGTRLARWIEPRQSKQLYYSVWVYFPQEITLTHDKNNGNYLNFFQFKSRSSSNSVDPFWYLTLYNKPDTSMGVQLVWGMNNVTGPHAGEQGYKRYNPESDVTIPVGQWVNFEAFLNESKDYDGQLTIWMNGQEIFNQTNIKTSYDNCTYNSWCSANEWLVNNYSDGTIPNPLTIFMDDAAISLNRIWINDSQSIISATATPSATPTTSPTPSPTVLPSPTPKPTATPSPSPTPTPKPHGKKTAR